MHLSASKLLARKSAKADKMLLDRRDLAYSIRELILDLSLVLSFSQTYRLAPVARLHSRQCTASTKSAVG